MAGPLVGRAAELHALTRILDRVGDQGTAVVVSGAPGSGKTRLLAWAKAAAQERHFRIVAATGDEAEHMSSFGLVLGMLERGTRDPGPGPLDWLAGSHTSLYALYSRFVDLSQSAPLLVVIDDAQWADAPSLDLLGFLARRVRDLPIVLLLASGGGDGDARGEQLNRMAGDPDTSCLHLGALSPEASHALVRSRGWSRASDSLCAAFHSVTDGNPFLLVALLDELIRRGSGSRLPTIEDLRGVVPYRVTHGLLVQCRRLPPAAIELLQAVAVLGDEVELREAAVLASMDSSVAGEAADTLVRAGILQATGRLAFVQPIIRSAVYANLSTTARSQAHARAARLLAGVHAAPHRTAAHLLATDPVCEPWALEALRQAARQAMRHDSTETAAKYLRRALAEPLDSEQRVDVLRELGIAEARMASPSAIGHFHAALKVRRRTSRDALRVRAQIVRLLSGSLVIADRGEEALSVVEAAIAELGDGERELRVGLDAQLASVAVFYGRHAGAGGRHLDDLEREQGAGEGAEGRLLAMLAYRRLHSSADAAHAGRLAAQALAEGQLLSDPIDSLPLFFAGAVLDLAGRSGDAEQLFNDVRERASLSGDVVALSFASAGRSLARLHRGAVPDAMADAEAALDAATARGRNPVAEHAGLRCLILAAIEQGQLERCDRELDRHRWAGDLPDTIPGNQLLVARGRLRLAQTKPHQALTDLVIAGSRAGSWGRTVQFEWHDAAATAHNLLGHRMLALAIARRSRDLASGWGAARQLGEALCTLGVIEGGSDGVEHLRQAVKVLDGSDAHLQHARALVNLGALLRETGQPGEACRHLHVGLELSTALGAQALSHAAGAQLAAAGVPPSGRSESGRPGTLTRAERRIAEMAAGGLSNPEIARALFVSRKTVEMHLGNSYRKLGISARGQLAAAVGAS